MVECHVIIIPGGHFHFASTLSVGIDMLCEACHGEVWVGIVVPIWIVLLLVGRQAAVGQLSAGS
jgi:hypothetical protein